MCGVRKCQGLHKKMGRASLHPTTIRFTIFHKAKKIVAFCDVFIAEHFHLFYLAKAAERGARRTQSASAKPLITEQFARSEVDAALEK